MAAAVNGMSQHRTDLGNMLLPSSGCFKKGFFSYLMSLERVALKEDEQENAYTYIKEHLAGTNSFWSEEQVEDTLRNMREEQLRKRNEELERREQERLNRETSTSGTSSNHEVEVQTSHDEEVIKEKRDKARGILRMASSEKMKELLEDLCENADLRTLDIIIKYSIRIF